MRIGHGYDVHRFGDGKQIVIGGITIEHDQGLVAHSDGDVLIHALCDALLGACALGDIGRHFPDTDAAYANINSCKLLKTVCSLVSEQGYRVSNADMTIVAQAPKMAPHIAQMRERLASDMGLELSQVNIKATTTEGLGFVGEKQGIAAHAVVLLMVST